MDMKARAQEVADELVGTADTLADVATEDEANSAEFTAALDELVFCCTCCGWWCDDDARNIVNGDEVCDDCRDI